MVYMKFDKVAQHSLTKISERLYFSIRFGLVNAINTYLRLSGGIFSLKCISNRICNTKSEFNTFVSETFKISI